MEMECPVCGERYDKQGLENHMRLTSGKGHGPSGEMPPEGGEQAEESERPGPLEAEIEVPDATGSDHVDSLGDVVRLNRRMLTDPESFGIAGFQSMGDVEEDVEELETLVERQAAAIDELARVVEAFGRLHDVEELQSAYQGDGEVGFSWGSSVIQVRNRVSE